MTSPDKEMLTIALPKGKLFQPSADLLARFGYTAEGLAENSRKLVIVNETKKIQFIYPKKDKDSNIVLIEGRKNGNQG